VSQQQAPSASGRAAAPDVTAMAGPVIDLVAGHKPIVIDETRGFWEGTAAEELRVQVCASCGHKQLPGGPCCRECLSSDLSWEQAGGRGIVHSYTVVHRALHPAFAAQIPYVLADIQLDEGPVFTSNVTDVHVNDVTIGMPVEVWFDEPDTDAFGVPFRLPKFRPVKKAA
jgi:uncharacterized OB-fold protein